MSVTKMKYRMQELSNNKKCYRLTLSAQAFVLAVLKSKPISGYMAYPRLDGQWDVMVKPSTADQLIQQRLEGESMSDVVERLLKEGNDQ